MALQTFDTRQPTLGREITRGLATGITGALDKLAQSKLREIERQRTAQGLTGIGFEPEEATGISQLPERLQTEIVKDIYTGQRAATKETEKFRSEILAGERGAKEQERELEELERLEKTGKIDNPLKVRAFRTLGLEHKLSPETQAFQKVAQGFLRNAKNVFGSRVTNYDLQQYQQLFPSLMQSSEGRKMIIENIRRTNQAAKIRGQAMREVLRENKNRIPSNFQDLIEQKVGAELDKLAPSTTFAALGLASSQGSQELPDPSAHQGRKIRDNESGQILQSNGTQWVPVG